MNIDLKNKKPTVGGLRQMRLSLFSCGYRRQNEVKKNQ